MKSEYFAIYGAILSTLVFIWNMYNKLSDRGKLRVTGYYAYLLNGNTKRKEVLNFTIVNVGSKPIRISSFNGTYKKKHTKGSFSDFIIIMHNHNVNSKLEPGDTINEIYDNLELIDHRVKSIYILDTVGKKHFMKRKELKELIKNSKKD